MSDTEKPKDPAAGEATRHPSPGQQPQAPKSPGTETSDAGATDDGVRDDLGLDPVGLLEGRIRELEGQQGDLTDRLLRAHADMDNLRKRTEREKADSAKYAISKFALDIVGISDNFQRAVAAVPPGAREQEGTVKSLLEGVEMTERAFLQVLERHGVKPIDPMGEPFNPNLHQAVMEQEAAEVPAGTVIRVFQSGYIIEDRVLRPAMVVVSRGGAKTPKPAEAQDNGSGQGDATGS